MAKFFMCDLCGIAIDAIYGTVTLSRRGEGTLKKECCKNCFAVFAREFKPKRQISLIPLERKIARK